MIAIAFRFHSVQRSRAAAIKSFPLTVGRTSAITWGVIWSTQSPNIIKYHQASPSLTIVGGCRWYIYINIITIVGGINIINHPRWSWMVMEGHALWPRFPTGFNPAEILDPLRSWWYPRSGSSIGQPGDGPEGPEGPEGTCQARVRHVSPTWNFTRVITLWHGFIRVLYGF